MKFSKLFFYGALITLSSCGVKYSSIIATEDNRNQRWVQDIEYFENEFLQKAKTYTDSAKDSCQIILDKLIREIDDLSDQQIKLELSRCVVLADNAHTVLPLGSKHKIPLRFYRFSDGLYVVRSDDSNSKYLGSKILKINSIDIDQLETMLYPYISKIGKAKKVVTIDWIITPNILYHLGIVPDQDSLTITLLKDGKIEEIELGAIEAKNDMPWYKNWANLYPDQNPKANWKFIKSNKNKLPLYLKNADQGVFYTFDENEKLAYFHINSFWNDCPNFKEQVNEFNKKLKIKKDFNVVIDLRFHTGGDYTYSNKLATEPPKIINDDRKIFLITSNMTYSAAIVTAARVKYYAKEKIVIVGEEVGDRLKFWAESKACVLPNSGTRIYNPMKEHDWKDNKRGLFRTHFANFLYGVAAMDLNLDEDIKMSFADYQNNHDPIMEWIIKQK